MRRTGEPPRTDHVRGRVIYLLVLVALVQAIYPITANGEAYTTIIYQALYISLIAAGILVGQDSRRITAVLAASGLAFLLSGIVYALNPEAVWALLLGYGSIMPFQALVILVLLRFIFATRGVNRDIICAASAVYLLLGAIFVPVHGLIETLAPGSYVDGALAAGQAPPWQSFIYYSYATLTTVGYGDVTPISMWARSVSSMEAIIGVLYLTVIMARLVGLYAQEKS